LSINSEYLNIIVKFPHLVSKKYQKKFRIYLLNEKENTLEPIKFKFLNNSTVKFTLWPIKQLLKLQDWIKVFTVYNKYEVIPDEMPTALPVKGF